MDAQKRMRERTTLALMAAGLGLALVAGPGQASPGLMQILRPGLSAPPGGPTESEVSKGLLEALSVGAEKAVGRASAPGGFLDNPKIRIPLPEPLRAVGKTLRSMGLGKTVDEFEETLNRGAEKAAAKALPIFLDAIGALTFEDVQKIWKGSETAATEYLRAKTSEPLSIAFEPIVHAAAQEVGVTKAYESLTANPLVQSVPGGSDLDLDKYVTGRALKGLFALVGDEEKQIRTNPVARTTELLKKVFGQ